MILKLLFKTGRLKLTLPIFLILFSTLKAQTISSFPWTEDFETTSLSVSSWTQINEVGNMNWDIVELSYSPQVPAYEGSRMAHFIATSFSGLRTKFVSPVLNLSAVSNPTLQFHYRNGNWGGDQNVLRIFYRTSSSATWTQLQIFNSDVPNWTSSGTISLPNPSEAYQIAFEGEAFYGYSITVDQIVVSSTLGVNSFELASIKAYPNPVKDILKFESSIAISSIEVYNYLGQKVLDKVLDTTQNQADLSILSSGNYLIKVKSENAEKTFKIVKTDF